MAEKNNLLYRKPAKSAFANVLCLRHVVGCACEDS